MNTWPLLRPLMFRMNPERAHAVSMAMLDLAHAAHLGRLLFGRRTEQPVEVMGLTFPNRVGLAAGLDKNADHLDALAACGFGFIEVGTVTPVAQPGNERPRLFRLVDDAAIINRMGFNNKGVDYLVERVRKSARSCRIGINIGKNKATPNERAVDDYLAAYRKVYAPADYVAINISSPNTPGLRALQHGEALSALLAELRRERQALAERHGHRPLVVKIAPDLEADEIRDLAGILLVSGVDGVIATNTTNAREGLGPGPHAGESGGLSGAPLTAGADRVLESLAAELDGRLPIIASGGVMSAEDACRKIERGASLVQLYTGFIYHGPELIRKILQRCPAP